MEERNLFGIHIHNIDYKDLLHFVDTTITNQEKKYIVTCNVDHIMQLQSDEEFLKVYNNAGLVTADGMPLIWASKLLKKPLKTKVSGSDIIPELGKEFEKKQYKMFFLGAGEGVALKAAKQLKKQFPNMKIVGCYSPPFGFEKDKIENEKIINMLKESKADILFVGLGAPKQEKWIYNNYETYNIPISIGVGATFDFLSGNVKRAPLIMQKLGLEWLWRLGQEPKRLWKRYLLQDTKFFFLFVKELLR